MSTELTVIGGGPAGLAAATAASESGVSTTLIDEHEFLGGQYFRQPRARNPRGAADGSADRGASAIAAMRDAGVSSLVGATAYSAAPGRVEVELEQGRRTMSSSILIATGATERVVPVPGWTLPGVVTCGAAQAMVKMHGEPVGKRVLVAGSGPFLLPVAAALIRTGAEVAGVVEAQKLGRRAVAAVCSSPDVVREAAGHLWTIASARSRLRTGWGVVRIDQRPRGLRVVIGRLDRDGVRRDGGSTELVDCDAVCLSDGFIPAVDLGDLAGAGVRFLPRSRTWGLAAGALSGETAAKGVWAAGACVSPWSGAKLSAALGELAGRSAATELLGGRSERSSAVTPGRSRWLADSISLTQPELPGTRGLPTM